MNNSRQKKLLLIFLLLILGLTIPVMSFALGIADAGGPYETVYGMPVTFDGSGSTTYVDYIVSWEWDLDYDTAYDDASGQSVTVASTSFWPGPGTYTIDLLVTDFENGIYGNYTSYSDTATLTLTPEPATILLLGSGLIGIAGFRKKFRKA